MLGSETAIVQETPEASSSAEFGLQRLLNVIAGFTISEFPALPIGIAVGMLPKDAKQGNKPKPPTKVRGSEKKKPPPVPRPVIKPNGK